MRWTPGGSSDDVEDRRGEGGGGGGFQVGGIHLGLGGIVVLFILSLIFKRDFLSLLSTGSVGTGTSVAQSDPARDQSEQPVVQFVTFVLNDAQNTWSQILPAQGVPYRHAKLVLFRDSHRFGLRPGPVCNRPVLLSRGREGLYRPGFLRRT